jgi:glutamyl-tRNA synthetase
MVSAILDGLRWLEIDWDEGPFFQSAGIERHRRDVDALLASGHAYRDFSLPEELARLRDEDPARARRYPRDQADRLASGEADARAAAGEPHAVRFRVEPGETSWEDAVHGTLAFQNDEIEDLVLLRSDRTPTYNLAVASDDAESAITHVIRGDDHISNTPKQILLLRALGKPVPLYAHTPMILGEDGKKLSKRHGATSVEEYAKLGILPDAMVNFLALLGWSPGNDEELLTRAELIEKFSLDRVLKKSAVFDHAKLDWLNRQHMARLPAERLAESALQEMGPARAALERKMAEDKAWILQAIDVLRPRSRSVAELAQQIEAYLGEGVEYDPGAVAQHWSRDPATATDYLRALEERFAAVPWEAADLEGALRGLADERGVAAAKLIHPLRVALTGTAASPGIFEVLGLLGRERALRRVRAALEYLEKGGRADA